MPSVQRTLVSQCTPQGRVTIEHVTWTPGAVTMDPAARLPSTWRGDSATKPLTDRAISRYAREGRYGKAVQLLRAKTDAWHAARSGIIHRCACGQTETVRYLRFSYLPKPGYWCLKCQAFHRATIDRERELKRQFNERIRSEYV